MLLEKERKRFFAKVNKDGPNGCWEWIGYKDKEGYGQVSLKRLEQYALKAHRVSYMQHKGKIADDLLICHKCDNPSCVNPDHLFLGTHQDNVDDKVKKNRQYLNRADGKGVNNPNAKLTKSQVKEITGLFSIMNNKEIGLIYKVHHSSISSIRRGKSWASVTQITTDTYKKYDNK